MMNSSLYFLAQVPASHMYWVTVICIYVAIIVSLYALVRLLPEKSTIRFLIGNGFLALTLGHWAFKLVFIGLNGLLLWGIWEVVVRYKVVIG